MRPSSLTVRMTHEVLTAVDELEKEKGCSIRVISWHTLKPLKEKVILPLVKDGIPVMVIEEQMSGGSLGSRLALFFKERAIHNPFCHLHLPGGVSQRLRRQGVSVGPRQVVKNAYQA